MFGRPQISDDEIAAVVSVLKSGWIGHGPRTREFEENFAKYQNVPHAIATQSCSAALLIALKALEIGPGDEVIFPAITFAATVNAIIASGATPIPVDVTPVDGLMDLSKVEPLINQRTRAILPVHLAGTAVDVDRLGALRDPKKISIIHDCAHAIETRWRGKSLAAFGDVACYSFYSTKNITSIEGGMVCSSDPMIAKRARLISQHGMSEDAYRRFSASGFKSYDILSEGFKFTMTDVQAALGNAQLQKIEGFYRRRTEIWNRYLNELSGIGLQLPLPPRPELHPACHLFRVEASDRNALLVQLQEAGVGVGVHYPAIPLFTHYQKRFGWDPKNFPVAMGIGERTLSLPLTPFLMDKQVSFIIETVQRLMQTNPVLSDKMVHLSLWER